MDCTFCLDCVKACPHDNVAIFAGAPGRDLARDPVRSSLGRFSRRPDVAALALVVVLSAFASAAAMVVPVAAWRERATLAPAPAFLLGAAMVLGGFRIAKTRRDLFCRFSLGLLPLGLAMWGAHLLFHLSTGWSTAWPVVQRAAGDLGAGWPGAPGWTPSGPLFTPHAMLAIQMLLLDAGVLVSLYVGWRIARSCAQRPHDGLLLLAPWAVGAALLYAAGIWIFLQPMQMRGMVHG
jgi:hypothetical protein